MRIKRLSLANFRNYQNLTLEFDEHPTVLVGNNGAGKSNLLEAIYFLSTAKSQRVEQDSELIKTGQSFCRAEGETMDNGQLTIDNSVKLEVVIQNLDRQFSKKVKVNGVSKRVVDFLGQMPAIIFYPSDINMVTGPPALRRWHLDLGLAQIDREYRKSLTAYGEFLTARNKVLKRIKEGQGRVDELEFWTDELVKNGQVVTGKRRAFFEFVNSLQTPLGNFQFVYSPSEISTEKLQATNGREIAASATLIGPHRDDFAVVILSEAKGLSRMRELTERAPSSTSSPQDDFGRNLSSFGSRGEQRTATLAFKLAQLEYMARTLGARPILLLDDVFSELDASHRAHVTEIANLQQTIISTVELDNIPQDFLNSARILKVDDGKIKE